jgi:hypothetical protein
MIGNFGPDSVATQPQYASRLCLVATRALQCLRDEALFKAIK